MPDCRDFQPMGAGTAFGLANKLERLAWQAGWLLLARWTPAPLFGWRRLILRIFGAKIGKGARIYANVRIWLPRNLSVGPDALIGRGVELYNQGRITIADRAVVSQQAHICASTHNVDDQDFALIVRPIVIRQACWVAAGAFVGPGVTMGEGSVLAARGALFANTAPMTIYRGNPAVALGQRIWRGSAIGPDEP